MQTASQQESSRSGTRGISRLSITACLRCRDQKLKCGREHPICARCDRLGANCIYPNPPDRRGPRSKRRQKLLHNATEHTRDSSHSRNTAAQQSCNGPTSEEASPSVGELSQAPFLTRPGPSHSFEENTAPPSNTGIGDASGGLAAGTPVLSDSYPTQLRRMRSIATESIIETKQPPLPPTALGLSLLEIYFARIYNASLLFHKPILFQDYLEGKIHGALLRALFALATLFLHPRDDGEEPTQDENPELKVLSVYHSCGLPWAKTAMREAMSLALEFPSLMVVQALECVQLYWFGIGQPHSGNLCLALAYRSSKMLGFDTKSVNENDGSVEPELKRRCFWACWTSTCIVMEPEPYIESAWKEVAMLPLPCSILSKSSGCPMSYNQMMSGDWHSISVQSFTRDSHPPTAVGLLIKMIGVWAKVQLLCKDHSSSGISKNLNSKQHLSRLATSLFDDACFVRASVHQDDNIPDVQILLIHDAVYHQCQIVLHAMIVPLFSGAPTDPIVDPETQRKAAETVTHHADLFEHLLAPYLYNREDVSRVPPLVGYGAFVVGIVILSTQISRHNQSMSESTVNTGGMENRLAAVEAILRLIGSLRIYWRALQHPWETLHSALKAGRSVLRKSSRLIESQDIQPSVYSNNNRLSTTLEESNQPMNLENAHPQPSATYRNARKYTEDSQPSATSRDNGGSGLDSLVDMTANDSSMSQIGLLPDPEWYSLSFAEAGVEQFCGLEPSILFQQGWKVFS